jgi:hypothetical protein
MRQSYNSQETVLVSSNLKSVIQPAAFSPLLISKAPIQTAPIDEVFAQPLYVAGIATNLTRCTPSCNMLVVAALGGGIYAFNAGDTTHTGGTSGGKPIWSRNTQTLPGGYQKTNYLWYDDCGSGLAPGASAPLMGCPSPVSSPLP